VNAQCKTPAMADICESVRGYAKIPIGSPVSQEASTKRILSDTRSGDGLPSTPGREQAGRTMEQEGLELSSSSFRLTLCQLSYCPVSFGRLEALRIPAHAPNRSAIHQSLGEPVNDVPM
jgi:hypothetical protein